MRQNNSLLDSLILILALSMFFAWITKAWSAEVIDVERLADAIYRAEGGDIDKPFGILKDYCLKGDINGQCRKGCIQTINKWKTKLDYKSAEEFIRKFGEIYAPTKNATNDPNNLNANWYRNVWAFYSRNSH